MKNIAISNIKLKDLPYPNYEYITSTDEALRHLEFIENHPIIEIDTETTGMDPFVDKIVLLQIGVHNKSYVFDVRKGRVNINIFKPLLEGNKNLKLFQNAVFDCKMLKSNFGIEVNRIYDTMIAEQLLYLGLNPKANLHHLVAKYLHLDMPKEAAATFENYDQEYQEYQIRYAANDVSVLKNIYDLQLIKLKQDNLMTVAQLEFNFIKSIVEMELNGMLLDVPKWKNILNEMVIERNKLHIQLSDIFNRTLDQNTLFGVSLLNLDSPVQLVKCLNDLGIHVKSTDIKELKSFKDNPIIKLLLEYRKYEKFITTYGEPMIESIHPITGRLHTNFKQMVDTGRLSSSNPNLQNIPKEQKYRSCFIARPGYKLITCMAADSIILTEKGPKKIEDIKINDKVFTHKNRYKKVINISKRFSDYIYKVKTYYNSSVYKITGNHPLLTLENDSFKWKPVNKFNKNDIVCFPVDNTVVNNNIIESLYVDVYKISDNKKIGQRRFKREHLLNKDFWRLIGYWIGAGHRTMYNLFLSFNIKDKKKCIEDVHEISKNLFGIDPGYRYMPGCVEIRIPEKNLSHFVSQFYINGNRGLKKLNPIIEHLPLNLQKELIIGYFMSDGHYYSGRTKYNLYNYAGFVSVSKQVLESIQRILLRFGIITSIQKVRNAGNDKIMGRAVNVKDKYELIGGKHLVDFLGIEAKYIHISKINYNKKASKISEENRYGYYNGKTKGFFKNGYFCFPIKSIVKVNWQKPVFNLEVEDDHSYCLHLLTTHNCDMSAAELRIIANLSKDPLWIKIFNEGGDLHTVSASAIYGISEEEVIADKQLPDDDPNKKNYRNNSKPISFGLAYGLSADGLALRLGISKNEAQKMIDNYFKKYPAVKRFLEESGRKAVLRRFSTSISGRRRYYRLPEPTDPNFNKIKGMVERRGKNMPIQGSLIYDTNIKGLGNIGDYVDKYVTLETGFGPNTATGVYSGQKYVYKLTLSNGIELGITLEHKIPVCTDDSIINKQVCDLELNKDMLFIPLNIIKGRSFNTLGYKKEIYSDSILPNAINKKLAFIIGCLIGGGNYSKHNFINFECKDNETELLYKFVNYIKDLFDYNTYITYTNKACPLANIHIDSIVIRDFLEHIGLDYVEHANKYIPKIFFTESIENRCALLDGLFSTIGEITEKDGISYTTISKQLAIDIQQLLFSIGINSNLKTYTNKYGYIYRIQVPDRFIGRFLDKVECSVKEKRHKLFKELKLFARNDNSIVPKFIPKLIYANLRDSVKYKNSSEYYEYHLDRFKEGLATFSSWRKFFKYMKNGQDKKFLSKFIKYDFCTAKSIEPLGMYDTYDLVCDKDPRYFIANGVIVHNSNADTIKQSMIYLVDRLKPYNARLLSTVHDEVIVEVEDDEAEEVKYIVEQSVKDGFNNFFDLVKMEAEAYIADYWMKG